MSFQICVNCAVGTPGYPHLDTCPRPKYTGMPDEDTPAGQELRRCARESAEIAGMPYNEKSLIKYWCMVAYGF